MLKASLFKCLYDVLRIYITDETYEDRFLELVVRSSKSG